MKKKILLLFPQGIGDMIYTVDQFLFNIKSLSTNYELTFIIQYKQNFDLLAGLIKNTKFKAYYTPRKSIEYLYLFRNVFFTKYDYLLIDPNVNIIKASIFSIFINSKTKIFKNFKFHQFFFNKVLNLKKLSRHQQMFELSKIFNNSNKINRKYNYKKFNLSKFFKDDNTYQNIIGVAPGSGDLEKHKRWPKEYFVDLINQIISENKINKIFIFGSHEENNLLDYLKKNCKSSKVYIYNKDIILSLQKLKQCKFLIANDNGMIHAAQCLEINHIAIIGPTNPIQFVHKSLNNFIKLNLSCSPCYDKKRFGCGDEICLKNLNPTKVKNKIYEIEKQNNIF
jgi:ADP-heptose:LPS heptosyltransferase